MTSANRLIKMNRFIWLMYLLHQTASIHRPATTPTFLGFSGQIKLTGPAKFPILTTRHRHAQGPLARSL